MNGKAYSADGAAQARHRPRLKSSGKHAGHHRACRVAISPATRTPGPENNSAMARPRPWLDMAALLVREAKFQRLISTIQNFQTQNLKIIWLNLFYRASLAARRGNRQGDRNSYSRFIHSNYHTKRSPTSAPEIRVLSGPSDPGHQHQRTRADNGISKGAGALSRVFKHTQRARHSRRQQNGPRIAETFFIFGILI